MMKRSSKKIAGFGGGLSIVESVDSIVVALVLSESPTKGFCAGWCKNKGPKRLCGSRGALPFSLPSGFAHE